MNDQTAVVVLELADRLGTTSEYVWSVLIKQAPVHAMINIILYIITFVSLAFVWWYREKVNKIIRYALDHDVPDIVIVLCLIFGGLALTGWLIACLFSISGTITAFVNPEYWALNEILKTVKPSK